MHAPCAPVTTFDDELRSFVADMVATMYAADGVGLAANQVGHSRAIFVFDCPDDDHVRHTGVVCNPVLTVPEGRDRKLDDSEEGCLSLPGAFVPCARATYAIVEASDLDGKPGPLRGQRPARPLPPARDRPHRSAPCSATGSPTGPASACSRKPTGTPTTTHPTWPA